VTNTAQFKPGSGRVEAPACDLAAASAPSDAARASSDCLSATSEPPRRSFS
jgi:hypothetical protein